MKISSILLFAAALVGSNLALASGQATNPPYDPETTSVDYMDGTTQLLGHLAVPEGEGPFPAVIIIPNWDGVNEYEQIRATMVAKEWNLVGFAADIYAVMPQTVEEFDQKVALANQYRGDADLFGSRIRAAIDKVNSMENVETGNIVLFGYCFGGTGVLQYGFNGNDDVKAVVSFHGGFNNFPEKPETFGPSALIFSGGDDNTPEEITEIEALLDTAEASWEIVRYSDIQHAFTEWTDERYNERADRESWGSAEEFIAVAFGIYEYETSLVDEASTVNVSYTGSSDGMDLIGHLALPNADIWLESPKPGVVVLPDWDGVNSYEKQRATTLAEYGYVAFAADIYGADNQSVDNFDEKVVQVTKYRTDDALYLSRIQDAISQLKMVDGVDPNEIAVIGYCFGGEGALTYSLLDGSEAKVAVSFHGNQNAQNMSPLSVDTISPRLLILAGGDDTAFGNQTEIETVLESGNARWEIQRYAGVDHGFTRPDDPRYSPVADARSWSSMMATLTDYIAVPAMKLTVLDIVAQSADHLQLTNLVIAYGLADALKTGEALTVFAPTDAAFQSLLDAFGGVLPDDETVITALLYHVVGAKVMSGDIVPGAVPTLAEPYELCIDVVDGEVIINGEAKVTIADIAASNGVVHVIDTVLIPAEEASECTAGQPDPTNAPVASPTNAPVAPSASAPVASPTSAPGSTDESEGVTVYKKTTLLLSGAVALVSAFALM